MTKIPIIAPSGDFPAVTQAWDASSSAPGLLAAGRHLDVPLLQKAYARGIFPWFSDGQPVLWWSPDPRMVLQTRQFRLHKSLRKTLQKFILNPECEIRFDSAFESVIAACAHRVTPVTSMRHVKDPNTNSGTWIVPAMISAYVALHHAGFAHSVETWVNGRLVGGLYCVALGKAVFGESMFSHQTDSSKIALAALVAFCGAQDIETIDCQQNTGHLASLGAGEIPRADFIEAITRSQCQPSPLWQFDPRYWQNLTEGPEPDALTHQRPAA